MKALSLTALLVAAQAAAFSAATSPAVRSHLSPPHLGRPAPSADGLGVNSSSSTSLHLSPSSTAALLVCGGASDVVLKNFYGDALGFFGGIRIPATFLAGSSLAAIFTLKTTPSDTSECDAMEQGQFHKLERRVIKFYRLASLLAFLLSVNTIVTATSAHVSVLHGRFDHLAETAYLLMKREFEYEFVSVRWSFLASIFCFLGMVTSRVLIEFDLCKGLASEEGGSRKDAAFLVICAMGALAANLLSYVNQTLWCWRSLLGMTGYLAKLVWDRAFVEKRPLQMISAACALASVFFVGKMAVDDLKEE